MLSCNSVSREKNVDKQIVNNPKLKVIERQIIVL